MRGDFGSVRHQRIPDVKRKRVWSARLCLLRGPEFQMSLILLLCRISCVLARKRFQAEVDDRSVEKPAPQGKTRFSCILDGIEGLHVGCLGCVWCVARPRDSRRCGRLSVALVESFARGELPADWTNILSNPRADFRVLKKGKFEDWRGLDKPKTSWTTLTPRARDSTKTKI